MPAVAALVLLLSGCSGVADKVNTLMSSTTAAPTTTSSVSAVTAQQVVDEFAAKGLPVPNPRDNSKNCSTQGCSQLITTDAISVVTFADDAAATKYVETAARDAFRHKLVVLSYTAARTPAADRPKYEAVLTSLVP